MKKYHLFATLMVMIVLICMTLPVNAARGEPIGTKIRVRDAEIEFPMGEPFNIQHGWIQASSDGAIGIFGFELEIDGVVQRETYKSFSAESGDPDILTRIWVYNFPEGMAGVHTFTGHWFAPCQYAVNELGYPGPCQNPSAKVETNTKTLVIKFTNP